MTGWEAWRALEQGKKIRLKSGGDVLENRNGSIFASSYGSVRNSLLRHLDQDRWEIVPEPKPRLSFIEACNKIGRYRRVDKHFDKHYVTIHVNLHGEVHCYDAGGVTRPLTTYDVRAEWEPIDES